MAKKTNKNKTGKRFFGILFRIVLASIPLLCGVSFLVFLKDILYWLVFPFAVAAFQQSFKLSYEIFAEYCPYSEHLLKNISWCWFIYKIMNALFVTSMFYLWMIGITICDYFHLGNNSIYIIICTLFACVFTTISSTPYFIRKIQNSKKPSKRSIEADANRVFIMIAYMTFLIVTCIRTTATLSNFEIVASCFLIYLAYDRLYATIVSNLSVYKETFDWMKKDTEDWLKKNNKDYKKRNAIGAKP